MALSLGTVVGQIRIDISQASAAYAALRAQHLQTVGALQGSAEGFRKSGLVMVGVGALMVGAFAKAASSAADFEKRLDFFGAVSNTTASQMEAVRAKALQLGKDTKYSANEIADSFIELGKAGVSAEDIINGVGQAVASLGASADIPLADAANVITSQLQVFNLKASDAVHVANELQGAANASIAEVSDLATSLKYVGGVAAAVHIPFESTVDAISLLAKAGIRGSTAGTSLRQILVSLQGNSAKATSKLKELGIITKDGSNAFVDAHGHIKPLAEVFQILQDHTKGLTEAERLMAFKTIFNNRALASANILTAAGAKGFAEMNKAIAGTTAADVAAKRMDNLSGDIEILRGNIETLLIQAGTPFQKFLRGVVQGLTKVIQFFGNLPAPLQTAIFAFLGIAGAALVMIGTFNLIIGQILTFGATIIKLGQAFSFIKNIITAVRTAFIAFNLVLLANPIVLIVAAIVALIAILVILYFKSETVRNAVNAVGRAIVSAWNAVLNFFKGAPAFFSGVWKAITDAFSTALDWVKRNWPLLLAIITGPIGLIIYAIVRFKDQIVSAFQTAWTAVKNATVTGVNAVVSFVATLPERIAYWIGFAVGRMIRIWIDVWQFLQRITAQGADAVVGFFKRLPGEVASAFVQTYNQARAIFQAMWNWIRNATIVGFNAVVSFFQQLPGRAATFFSAMYRTVVSWMSSTWSAAKAKASQILSGIVSFFQQLPARAGAFFSSMYNTIKRWLGQAVSFAKSSGSNIVSGIMNAITSLPGLIGGVFQKAIGAIGNFASAAFDKAKSIGSSLWNGFKDGLGINSPSFIEKAMFQIRDTLGVETNNLKSQVRGIQGLGNSLIRENPVSAYSAATAGGFQHPGVTSAARAMAGAGMGARVPAQRRSAVPVGASGGVGSGGGYNVTINNPTPEPASDSLYRTHQKLIYLGLEDDA